MAKSPGLDKNSRLLPPPGKIGRSRHPISVIEFFMLTFLFLADLHNRTHVLLLIGTVMTYSILVLGLVALGAHVNRAVLRVLQAIDAR